MSGRLYLAVGGVNREAPYFQGARGQGLTVLTFNEETLVTEKIAALSSIDNPTYLSVDAAGTIYANSEVYGWHEGTVTAIRFLPATGELRYLNKQPTLGSITAHNTISSDGRFLLVANYAMGEGGPDQSVVVFPVSENGAILPASTSVRLRGELGPDRDRQERPHAHMVSEAPGGKAFMIADLGLDQLIQYRLSDDGRLIDPVSVSLAPGAGPRHIAQHANGRFVYVANELDSTVSFILREPGTLVVRQTLSTIPGTVASHGADIHLSPDGRFLYCSNRGDDSIACFGVDQQTGHLTPQAITPSFGLTPRNFALTPSGRHLLVANQNSDRIVILQRNEETGALTDTGKCIDIGTPVCVKPFVI